MRIGVLGGGQLGKMLGTAGAQLGIEFRFLDPNPKACAQAVGTLVVSEFSDVEAIRRFASGLDLVTTEFENVPAKTVETLNGVVPFAPGADALATCQDRLAEKSCFRHLTIETANYSPIDCFTDLEQAVSKLGYPAILKTRRLGYDGKGQFIVRSANDLTTAWERLGSVPCILESFIPFKRELSIIGVRSSTGEVKTYPLVENRHVSGILDHTVSPALNLSPALQKQAYSLCEKIMGHLNFVGVLTIELFDCGDRLLANEMAPRVHNSGHWTIEGAVTSQFENHLRAILGLPLGETTLTSSRVEMFNIVGLAPNVSELCAIAGAHIHLYGKTAAPGRKLGHVTLCNPTAESVDQTARLVSRRLSR